MRVGTSHFVSMASAQRYYADYHLTAAAVARKIAEGEIHIGQPETKPGQTLSLIDNGTRYAIEETEVPVEHPAIRVLQDRLNGGWTHRAEDINVDDTETPAATSDGDDGTWVRCWVFVERDAYEDQME